MGEYMGLQFLASLAAQTLLRNLNMKTMLIVVLALCAMAVAEEETLQAEEQTLLSYGAYPHAFRYGYGAVPYGGYPYAARTVLPYAARSVLPYAYPSTYAVAAAARYNYNFLDTTKEPSAYLPRSYPYVY